MELTYNQRQFVFERFSRALSHYKLFDDKRLPELFGPTTQTLIKEALHTYCFAFPLKFQIIDKDLGLNSQKKKVVKQFCKFVIHIDLPIFKENVTLEDEIEKEILESK